jgi:hypothetical protein
VKAQAVILAPRSKPLATTSCGFKVSYEVDKRANTKWRLAANRNQVYCIGASCHLLLTEKMMEKTPKTEKVAVKKEEPVAVPNHTEKITSQVLARIGKPPRLDRVEVSLHHNGNYRVNIWVQPEPSEGIAVSIAARIRSSYYLKVSDTGEILQSNPPLAKSCSSA